MKLTNGRYIRHQMAVDTMMMSILTWCSEANRFDKVGSFEVSMLEGKKMKPKTPIVDGCFGREAAEHILI